MRTYLRLVPLLLLASSVAAAQHRAPRGARAPAAPPAAPPPTQAVETPGFALRPIDRATVRVIAVRGLTGRFARGRSGALRLVANESAAFGSGVVVSRDGVVLTARHVVEGADLLAVVFPGQRVAVPAVTVYADTAHDVAFLAVQTTRPIADVVTLPTTYPTLTSGQRVLASGYPLDPEERYPAAVAGEFARLNNDGRLQLSISLNHGNSGGPVVDEAGRLMGVVSMRGEPERGVEGLSLVEPIRNAAEPWRREGSALPRPAFGADDAGIAQAAYDLLRLDPDRDARDPASAERVLSLANAPLSPEAAAVVGAQAWNEALVLLENHRAASAEALTPDARPRAESLLRVAADLQLRALREAPYLRTNYPFLYWFARIRGNVVAPPPAPLRDNEAAQGERVSGEGSAVAGEAEVAAEGPVAVKLRAFVQQQLRLQTGPSASASPQVTVTLRVNASGTLLAAVLQQGTGDAACDAEVTARLRALVERHPRVETLTSGELASVADRDISVVLRLRRG